MRTARTLRNSSHRTHRAGNLVETLDRRTMLAGITVSDSDWGEGLQVAITGSSKRDDIVMTLNTTFSIDAQGHEQQNVDIVGKHNGKKFAIHLKSTTPQTAIEKVTLESFGGDDRLKVTNKGVTGKGAPSLYIEGDGGQDFIRCNGEYMIANGGEGNDFLLADRDTPPEEGSFTFALFGGPGHDLLEGSPFDDILVGGPDDHITGIYVADTIYGHEGDDTILIEGPDKVDAGAGDDTITKLDFHDLSPATVNGGIGNDTLYVAKSTYNPNLPIEGSTFCMDLISIETEELFEPKG